MAFVEGRGFIIPKPIVITLDNREVRDCQIITKQIAKNKGYDLGNALIGWYGQAAIGKYFYQEIGEQHTADFEILDTLEGDGGVDVELYDLKMQIKTRSQGKTSQIKRIINKNKLLPLVSDIYIFCEMITPPMNQIQNINLLGFIFLKELEIYGEIHPPYFNLYINDKYFYPMAQLIQFLLGKKRLWHL